MTVTNAPPIVIVQPPNHSIVHGKSISMNLTEYVKDEDGDTLTMTATFKLDGGTVQPIPIAGGIFT